MATKAQADDWINNISSGSSSKTEKEIDATGDQLNSFFLAAKKNLTEKNIRRWNKIAAAAQDSDMLFVLSQRIETEVFFDFGEQLIKNYAKELRQKQSIHQQAASALGFP